MESGSIALNLDRQQTDVIVKASALGKGKNTIENTIEEQIYS